MADHICGEIIVNILCRLPAKTLLRCAAVCKSWYSLVTSPLFISSHSNFSKKFPLVLLRRCLGNSEERYDLFSDNDPFAPRSTLEFPFRSMNSFFTIVGTCNGLLCLSDDRVFFTHTVILWNPCIKRSIVLPKPDSIYSSFGTLTQSLGFGFDPVAGDYKVVRITYADCVRVQPPRVELFRLSTGVWEDLGFVALDCVIYSKSRQAYVGRAAHWVACRADSCDLIVYFDLCDEVFGEMMLPCSLANDSDRVRSKDLVAYNESLALISWNVSGTEPSFCVWVMKEYGVSESWMKHLSVDFGERFTRPLWVRKRGEVMTVSQDGRLVSYDGAGEEVKDLGVDGSRAEEYRRSIHVDSHMESLVLLEKGPCSSDVLTRKELPILYTSDCDSSGGSDNKMNSESVYKRGP